MFCKFQPGVFGNISFITPYEDPLLYFLQGKNMRDNLPQCSQVPLWESSNDHYKPGNISQNSDFSA